LKIHAAKPEIRRLKGFRSRLLSSHGNCKKSSCRLPQRRGSVSNRRLSAQASSLKLHNAFVAKELEQKMNNLKSEAQAVPIWDYSRVLVHYSATTPSVIGGWGRNWPFIPAITSKTCQIFPTTQA
jgi:hypothetical protein